MDEELPEGFEVKSMPPVAGPIETSGDELPEGFNVKPRISNEEAAQIDAQQPQSIEARDERDLTALRSGQVTDLPDPEHVFEGLPEEQVEALKTAYNKHPEAVPADPMITGGAKGVTYKGKFVPAPADAPVNAGEAAIFGGQKTEDLGGKAASLGRGVGKGVVNAATNVVETALAGADVYNEAIGADKIYGIDTSKPMTEKFREVVPELKAREGDDIEKFGITAGEIGAGTIGGVGIAGAASKIYKLGKLAKAGTMFAGGNLGGALTQDVSDQTLYTGEGSLLDQAWGKTIPSLSIDKEGNTSENILKKRLVLAQEAITTGLAGNAVGATVGKLAKWGWGKTVNDILDFTSLDGRQKEATLKLAKTMAGLDPENPLTDAQSKQIFEDWINTFDENTRFKILSGDPSVGDIDVTRSTVRAAQETGISPQAETQVLDTEGGVRARSAGPLDRSDAKYGDYISEGSERALKETGGGEHFPNIEKTKEQVITGAEAEVQPKRVAAARAKELSEEAIEKQRQNLTEDPLIGGRVQKIAKEGDAGETLGARGETVSNIRQATEEKLASLDEGLKQRTDAIPEGLRMNNPVDISEKVQELAGKGIISKDLVNRVHAAQINDGLGGLDYKKLTDAIKRLKFEKDRAFKNPQGNLDAADELRELDELIKRGTPQADEITEWNRYYQDEWAPYAKEGKTGEFRQVTKDTRTKPVEREVGQKQAVTGALEEEAYTKQMRDLLAQPQTGRGNQAILIDQALTDDIVSEVQKHVLKGGKLEAVTPEMLTPGLQKRIAQIRRANPEIETSMTDLFSRLRKGKEMVEKTGDLAEAGAKRVIEKEKEVFGDTLGTFFEGGAGGFRPREETLRVFDDLVSKGNTRELKKVVEHVKNSGNPEAVKGMQAAWWIKYRDTVLSKGKKDKGAMDLATGKASQRPGVSAEGMANFDKGSDLYKAGSVIFEDKKELLDYIEALTAEASKSQRSIAASGEAITAAEKATADTAGKAKNLLITLTLGVLNPTATKVRGVSSAALSSMDPKEKLFKYLETIMADSEEFSKMAKKYYAQGEPVVSPEMKQYIRKTMIKAGIRDFPGGDILPEDRDFERKQEINKGRSRLKEETKGRKSLATP